MFYSHEILTDRKHGVATVWLIATLGAKSNTKKVNRKTIEKVDVKNVCKTIMKPEAPLALRLQSNLLIGVSRVHLQQWEYLLHDVQAAQNIIRTLMRTVRNGQLDDNAGKAQPDQLVLMDDPAFAIDNALPALDLGFWDIDPHKGGSQRSTQSMLSMRSRSGSVSSSRPPSVLGINLSSSSRGSGFYQLSDYPLGGSSVQKPFHGGFDNDEDMMVVDDDLFDFDADGNMRDLLPADLEARRAASLAPRPLFGSDSAANERVRQEHEDARAVQFMDEEKDLNFQFLDNDYDLPLLPDASPFPIVHSALRSKALGTSDRPLLVNDRDRVLSDLEQVSSDTAEAQQKQKRKRPTKKIKIMKVDHETGFKKAEMTSWINGYLDNMVADTKANERQLVLKNSKKSAAQYVYGAGLNNVGLGVGSEDFEHPLIMFSGAALLATFTARPPSSPDAKKKGVKRINTSSEAEQSSPNKRLVIELEDEVARGVENDVFMNNDDFDQSVEIGRDAPAALIDYPSSAMPWNKSTSLLSYQHMQSSRPGSQAGRRLTSASPLVGRGSVLPRDLIGEQDEMVMYGRSDSLAPQSQQDFDYRGEYISSKEAEESRDYELFGAAAKVDTQTAADSQWVRSVLDYESNNFLDYVKNRIEAKFGEDVEVDELSDDFDVKTGSTPRSRNKGKGKGIEQESKITFEDLFAPGQNSHVVAAQAFYHILTLATKSKVWVHQDNGFGDSDFDPFGEIWVGVL